ncbi:MAG: Gfo/Idh/MocA family oxidoreductase [Alicyclobacillus herbarius]|uniref:Gfo/Idh/MocA family protein n=1 Tax=Alicyclobacillus herbarius TaxID=122960 RepID=UPI0023530D93|nr:Gfo/Idh/MocA family oxidoreductase [Alicyclobacillus herbarius]MCL6631849.1 Gfo/Idh/MocA family oxidoreductase [Alicyclobacillus herbarius]
MTQVAVIGAGQWGRNLVRTYAKLGVLAVVADVDETARALLSQEHPEVSWCTDFRQILQSDIPAVAIATPAATHYSLAREALLAHKDVFVEKPLTLSVSEARRLVEIARRTGRVLMVGHLLLFQPGIQRLKQLIDEGRVGVVRSIHQERVKLGRVRTVEDVTWSLGVHDLAVQHFLIGTAPERVRVVAQNVLPSGVADDAYLHLGYPGGTWSHLHVSWLWPIPRRSLTVIGSEGMLVFDEIAQTLTYHHKGVHPNLEVYDEGEEMVLSSSESALELECRHFLECVETRRKPIADGKQGLAVVQVLEAVAEQLRVRRRVRRGGYR